MVRVIAQPVLEKGLLRVAQGELQLVEVVEQLGIEAGRADV